ASRDAVGRGDGDAPRGSGGTEGRMSTRFDDPGSHSRALVERARGGASRARSWRARRRVIPGGTSKANFHVRPHPFYLTEGRGCRVTDADGVERLNSINNVTALIHVHRFPAPLPRHTL